MKESQLQKAFNDYLIYNRIQKVCDFNSTRHVGWFFAVINNEYTSFKEQPHIIMHNKRLGRCAGVSDMIVFYKKLYFLELKVAKNKQSPYQIQFQKTVELAGFEYRIIRNITDFKL